MRRGGGMQFMGKPFDETRRSFLTLSGVAIGATGFVGSVTSETETTTNRAWASFQHDAGNTGTTPDGTDPGPDAWIEWSEQVSDRPLHSPTVADGIVYVSDVSGEITAFDTDTRETRWTARIRGLDYAPSVVGDTVYAAGTDLVALSAADGNERWRFDVGIAESSPVTAADGTLFFKTSDVNGQGSCWAVDAATGTERWHVRLPTGKDGETPSAEHVPPAVVGGVAYFADKDAVYALRAEDGTPRWQASVDGIIDHAPTVANDTVYVCGERAFALSADDGRAKWKTDLGDSARLSQSPAVTDDAVVVTDGSRARIWALAADDGAIRWTVEGTGGSAGTPVIADETAYVPIADDEDGLVALDLQSGDQRWWVPIRNLSNSSLPPAIDDAIYVTGREGFLYAVADPTWLDWRANQIGSLAVDENVYVSNGRGHFSALDAETGSKRWRGEADETPVTANGMVYGTDWSAVVAYTPDGTERWRFDCDGKITTEPVVTDDSVVVAGDGWVTALDPTTGTHRWTNDGDCAGLGTVEALSAEGKTAFAVVDGRVVALDFDERQWSAGSGVQTIAVGDAVYTGTEQNEVVAYGFDGTELWNATLDDGNQVTSLVADDGLYAVTTAVTSTGTDSREWLVSLDEGTVDWTFHPKFLPFGSLCEPVVEDETVYVGASDRRVYALSAADGTEQRRFETGGVVELVAVDGDRVYATADETYAFR
ncbi:Pyrrolo-quinoline quinone [Haladaptatus paucihalophilus DX253]|uniref:Outer membrane protein assembly factor BamB, contains PQQ-like beta-propeller repeat n=1 Tax=Haladaptatus paucihalophilus DX253 TaxID=797209 RepID=E7QY93_HALPU|nr:PQQ-binding-like beta-propeller repeat protein [Haladaptatus paucihalophilus]EFW90559.1 Pyrrolo-quinoline quinone [Haladaptatus paucihalophilus DX253]SHK29543.1 Outer membrane protein assembly factor BamB, contains PQQ-like beta-propeller repeat [Haladaptatus paucihalophilus DX253]